MDSKRKIDESLAILNSLFAQPSKRIHSSSTTSTTTNTQKDASAAGAGSIAPAVVVKKRVYLPPRPAVLDKLSRLAASRPTLKDSIAASIAASAPTSHRHGNSQINIESPSSTTSATTPSKSLTSTPTFKSNKKRYMPWSREQFHERLETFKPSTWFDKPKLVNAIECAKRGWVNTADDRLDCFGGCGGIVIVRVDQHRTENGEGDKREDEEEVQEDMDIDMIADSDSEDSIYKFPVYSQSQAKRDFVERAQQLEPMADNPLVEKIVHPLSKEEEDKLTLLLPVRNAKIALLAVFGWQVLDQQPKVLTCDACHTQCTYIASAIENDDIEQDGTSGFDVVQAHKWYCYWVDPEHDRASGRQGWRIFLDLVLFQSRSAAKSGEDRNAATEGTTRLQPNEIAAQIKRILRGQVVNSPLIRS
ncbi:hypothetical protein BGZ83_000026 [Gryganskiella cystojenkinii]|nr:hypothetical protein BGZ83_000026 [Gryganskiella cystojenkinii]